MSRNTGSTTTSTCVLRPRPQTRPQIAHAAGSKSQKRAGKATSRPERGVSRKRQATVPLATPLEHFTFEPPLTHPTWEEWKEYRLKCSVTYKAGERITTGTDTMTWMMVNAQGNDSDRPGGYFLVPLQYYGLWRRLLWGGKWYESIWELWENDARGIRARDSNTHTSIEKWILVARRAAAIKTVWYTAIRCIILDELLHIDINDWSDEDTENNPVLESFIEFGIRDYRSWLFDSFDVVKKQGGKYLKLDPTASENEEAFRTLSLVLTSSRLT